MFNSYSDEMKFHKEYQKLMTEYLEAIKDFNFEEMKRINDQIETLKQETGYYNEKGEKENV